MNDGSGQFIGCIC